MAEGKEARVDGMAVALAGEQPIEAKSLVGWVSVG